LASPARQVALATFALFVVAGCAVLIVPRDAPVESHQLPPGTPGAPTVALPLIVDGNPAAGQATRVRVVSPLDSAVNLVDVNVGATESTLNVMGVTVRTMTGVVGPMTIQGDVLHDQVVTFTLAPPAGAPVVVRADRGTNPATVTITGASDSPISVQAPVAVHGDLASPTEVAVYNVANAPPTLLLRYHDNGNGTATLTRLDPTANGAYMDATVQTNLVVVSGAPLGDGYRLTVKNPVTGQPQTSMYVPLSGIRYALGVAGVNPDSYLVVAHNALPLVNAYKAATDGTRTLDPANLTGDRYLNGRVAEKVMVDVPEDQDLGTPALLIDPEHDGRSVTMQRTGAQNGYVRYEAPVPADVRDVVEDGAMLDFAIGYRFTAAQLVTDQLVDDNDGALYHFRLDKEPPGTPSVSVSTPDPAHPAALRVAWSATDDASGVAAYTVQKARVNGTDTSWEDWVQASEQAGADFTGEAGMTYRFRAVATDHVGLVSAQGVSAPVAVPGEQGSGAVNHAPSVQLKQPMGGERFVSVPSVLIVWSASDQDGTTPVLNLYWSDDGGATWHPLASPSGTQYAWDVSELPAGDYRVKVEATDGSLANQETSGKFAVDNTGLATANSIGGPNAQSPLGDQGPTQSGPPNTQAGPAGPEGSSLMLLGFGAVLVVAGAALVVWKLRARRP
jgi:hypothetical protein